MPTSIGIATLAAGRPCFVFARSRDSAIKYPAAWSGKREDDRRRWLLLTMLDAVYVDAREERRIVAIRPKAPFRPIFQVATTDKGGLRGGLDP